MVLGLVCTLQSLRRHTILRDSELICLGGGSGMGYLKAPLVLWICGQGWKPLVWVLDAFKLYCIQQQSPGAGGAPSVTGDLNPEAWGWGQDSAFPTSSQMMVPLLARGPHPLPKQGLAWVLHWGDMPFSAWSSGTLMMIGAVLYWAPLFASY